MKIYHTRKLMSQEITAMLIFEEKKLCYIASFIQQFNKQKLNVEQTYILQYLTVLPIVLSIFALPKQIILNKATTEQQLLVKCSISVFELME